MKKFKKNTMFFISLIVLSMVGGFLTNGKNSFAVSARSHFKEET